MKKFLVIISAVLVLAACGSEPVEKTVEKSDVEFGGNAFTSFSLGGDVKFFFAPNTDSPSKFKIMATVPVRKEIEEKIDSLILQLVPTNDKGVKVREAFVLEAEDMENILPVYNSAKGVEKTIVFSVPAEGKRDFTKKEAIEFLKNVNGVTMNVNIIKQLPKPASEAVHTPSAEKPLNLNTVDGLCRKYGVYGLLAQYDNALKNGNKSRAKAIEDQLWAIEKQVRANNSIPESVRKKFQDYVEDREDEIEDKY